MAEKYDKENLVSLSWGDWFSQDPYFWLTNSYQYSENIDVDSELHWIKLSQKAESSSACKKCQLISVWDKIFAMPMDWGNVKYFNKDNRTNPTSTWINLPASSSTRPTSNLKLKAVSGAVFQDYFWMAVNTRVSGWLIRINVTWAWDYEICVPYDHIEDDDKSISSITDSLNWPMQPWITAMLNFNNTRLVLWVGNELRVYYPELDKKWTSQPEHKGGTPREVRFWETGRKKVQEFENWSVIIWLTCTFEYLKVRVQDEWWNTKIYYYQGNNDLRNTYVYNLIDLTWTRVLRAYSINGIDYYTASLDGTDGFITLNKIIWNTPIQIFKQRWGLTRYDTNQKSAYFVWPTALNAWYLDGSFYIADAYGAFKFNYNPSGVDTWYLKWKFRSSVSSNDLTVWLAICQNYLYVSDNDWLHRMRLYDTWVDGYQDKWVLVSREFEWNKLDWTYTKILDEVRCHFELNPIPSASQVWSIDIYVSPNNLRTDPDPTRNWEWRYKVMHIDWESINTRVEITKALNNLEGTPAFEFDWQTITYCIVLRRGSTSAQRTPIVREINMIYHPKSKANNIYWITN